MATKISDQELANLAINLVKSPTAFNQMLANSQIQADEFYLVEGDEAARYTFADGTFGRFIVTETKNGVVTPTTVSVGSITGGSAIEADTSVIGGIVPTSINGFNLNALKKTITSGTGVVVSASGTNSIIIALSAVAGLTAGSVGPTSNTSPAHGGTVSIPYITYDKYGRITAASNKTLTFPSETQISLDSNAGDQNLKVVVGLSANNHQITVAKRSLVTPSSGALSIVSGTNTIDFSHKTSSLAAGEHAAGTKAFIKGITTDAFGHVTAISTAAESSENAVKFDTNATDANHATLIAGLSVDNSDNHKIVVARKEIKAGTGLAVSNTSANITLALASGVSTITSTTAGSALTHGGSVTIPVLTVDTYGRVTNVVSTTYTLPSETGLSGGSADGDDLKVVTGVTGSGHSLSVAKKELKAGTGIALSKNKTAGTISIALSTVWSGGSYGPNISGTAATPTTLAFGGQVQVPYVTIDSYGRTTTASTKYYKLPTFQLASTSGSDGAKVITGLSMSGTNVVTITPAKKTITAGSGVTVSTSDSAITIGITTLSVSKTSTTSTLSHGGTFVVPSSFTVNSLGQVTAIQTTTFTMPGETQLSIGNNAGATNCELINSITVNNHALTITKSKIVAGSTITVASQSNNGANEIKISHGSTNPASSVTPATDTFINGLTLDSFGHVTGISTAVESTGASLQISSNAGDDGSVFTGMTLSGAHNNEITVVKRAISAGNAITVSTTTAGKIIVNHSDTSSAVTIASAAGKFVNAISVDTYGHVTGMTTTSETVLAASGTTGTENNKVITGLAFTGHSIYAAKKTLEGTNGITVTNATDKLSIGITTLTVSATSGTKTLSHGGTVTVLSSVTTNSYGQTTAVKTVELTMPSETALSFSGSLSGADNGQVLTGFTVSGHQISSIARRTVEGNGAITVSTSTAGKILIAHSDTSSAGNITAASGKFLSGITLDGYGHVTAVTTSAQIAETSITMPSNSGESGASVITGITASSTANHTFTIARRTLTAGAAISISTGSGTIVIAHSDTSSATSVSATSRTYVNKLTVDAYGHVTDIGTATETVTNVDEKVQMSANSDAVWRKLVVTPMSGSTSSVAVSSMIGAAYYNNNISMRPSTGTLRANIFRVEDKVELQYNSTTDALDFVFI